MLVKLPELPIQIGDPYKVMIKWFEKLGWDKDSQQLNPIKVKLFDEDWKAMCEQFMNIPGEYDKIKLGLIFINMGPAGDGNTPGMVELEPGWKQ